jgi:hypothetical protein
MASLEMSADLIARLLTDFVWGVWSMFWLTSDGVRAVVFVEAGMLADPDAVGDTAVREAVAGAGAGAVAGRIVELSAERLKAEVEMVS